MASTITTHIIPSEQTAQVGYGWTCPPCKIDAGNPDDYFVTSGDAALGLSTHVADSHDGQVPDGAFSGEITWN